MLLALNNFRIDIPSHINDCTCCRTQFYRRSHPALPSFACFWLNRFSSLNHLYHLNHFWASHSWEAKINRVPYWKRRNVHRRTHKNGSEHRSWQVRIGLTLGIYRRTLRHILQQNKKVSIPHYCPNWGSPTMESFQVQGRRQGKLLTFDSNF